MDEEIIKFRQNFNSVSGEIIDLKIIKYASAVKVVLKSAEPTNTSIRCAILIALVLINAVAFFYNIVSANYILILLLCMAFMSYKILSIVKHESLLLVKDLGYQLNTNRVGGSSFQFIPYSIIDGVFINEVISRHRVLFVLTIRVKEPKNAYLVPLFTATKPRLKCIETIYQHIQGFV